MKKALITGITGFAGSHLAELLLKEGYEVYGTTRPRSKTEHIDHIRDQLTLFDADLVDSHSLYTVLSDVKPDYIFHLAAQAFVPTSWSSPATTMEANVIGSIHLFEAVRRAKIDPIIQIACSSEEYGLVHKNETPITEKNELRPLSTYAVSKIGMDFLGYQYFKSYAIRIIRTRGFNHTGPRQGDVYVCSTFAKQVALIEVGKTKPVIKVGNLESYRDFTDVRDMVRAYLLAVEKCEPGDVYNIAAEKAWKIKDVLNMLIKLSNKEITIEEDSARMRPSDVELLIGDATKFKNKTGWKMEIPFEQTLQDLLDYWRARV
ncbi:MAG: GDP-mannose 4,6-dehydratase [Candidatus Roizmanbacteria bacterium]|nr:GDP-mannose 4,6-dehydratase [Candidatus Roizmanbacteria bacterium]